MHSGGSRYTESLIIPLRHYAIRTERTVEEVAKELGKNYSTILRSTAILVDKRFLEPSRFERTSRMGKERRYYRITALGLETVLSTSKLTSGDPFFKNIRLIAKAHGDKSLVLKKWGKFVESHCEQALIANILEHLVHGATSQMLMFGGVHPESSWKTFDIDVLGFYYMNTPVDHVKEVLGDRFRMQLRFWGVAENDYELKQLREEVLHRLEIDHNTALKSLIEWQGLLKTLQKK